MVEERKREREREVGEKVREIGRRDRVIWIEGD